MQLDLAAVRGVCEQAYPTTEDWSGPPNLAMDQMLPKVSACPPRARTEEPPRIVTVSHGERVSTAAGQPIRRWRRCSATDFPS
jgi:hypothetical protein